MIRNVGGDSFRATSTLEDIKAANHFFLIQLKDLSRADHVTPEGTNIDSYSVLERSPERRAYNMRDGSEDGPN